MRPVYQTRFGGHDEEDTGNCFAACLASLLEVPIDTIPDFMGDSDWMARANVWLAPHGLAILSFAPPETPGMPWPGPGGCYHLMGGYGPSGDAHAVVALDGKMVHDPLGPDAQGLARVEEWGVLVNLLRRPPKIEGS